MLTDILKKCGRGVIYIITLPILLIVLSFYAVVGILQFFFVGIKSIWYFFTGRNLFGEFPEDVKAREILEGKTVTNVEPQKEESQVVTPPPPAQPYITTPTQSNNNEIAEVSKEEDKR